MKMKTVLIVVLDIVLLVAVGAGAFAAGRDSGMAEAQNIRMEFFRKRFAVPGAQTAPGTPSAESTQSARGQQPRAQLGQLGTPVATGTVKSVQGNTVQVTQRDGTTVTVTVDEKAVIVKTLSGVLADIQPGMGITVFEQTSGGSTTRRIQLTQAGGP